LDNQFFSLAGAAIPLDLATDFCNTEPIVFIEFGKWRQKGLVLQHFKCWTPLFLNSPNFCMSMIKKRADENVGGRQAIFHLNVLYPRCVGKGIN